MGSQIQNLLAGAGGQDAGSAAKAMESYFIRRMFAELRKSSEGGLLSGGMAGATFREMLDGALADAMAEGPGMGLAEILEKEMTLQTGEISNEISDEISGEAFGAEGADLARWLGDADAWRSESSVDAAGSGRVAGLISGSASVEGAAVLGPAAVLTASPVDGETTSEFGQRTDPIEGTQRFHAGIDIAAPSGAPVRSAGAGVVVRAGSASGYGNLVIVAHGDGLQTRYAHLSRIHVAPGQVVAAGERVGRVGQSGRATGPHLHFEVRQDGEPVDPKELLLGLKERL